MRKGKDSAATIVHPTDGSWNRLLLDYHYYRFRRRPVHRVHCYYTHPQRRVVRRPGRDNMMSLYRTIRGTNGTQKRVRDRRWVVLDFCFKPYLYMLIIWWFVSARYNTYVYGVSIFNCYMMRYTCLAHETIIYILLCMIKLWYTQTLW